MVENSPFISIVVPMYNEAESVSPLIKELLTHTRRLPQHFEFIFVDDGSADDSALRVQRHANQDKRIKVIQLARNFGKEAAVSAGLRRAKGDAAIIMDADLQMPPRLLSEFIAKWQAGAEVVVGVFAKRSMSRLHSLGSHWFYRLMQAIGHTKITPHATDYRLLDREVIDVFNGFTERNRITRGLIDWLGFRRDYIYFEQDTRKFGKPTYSFSKLVDLAINSFTSYSLVPLKLAGYLGVLILALATPLGIFLYVERFIMRDPLHWGINGTTMLAIMTLFLIGIVLACLGLMALYIAHIHDEVVNRPLFVARKHISAPFESSEDDLALEQAKERRRTQTASGKALELTE